MPNCILIMPITSLLSLKNNEKTKISLRDIHVKAKYMFISTFLFQVICVTIFCFNLNKMMPWKLLYRPISCSVLLKFLEEQLHQME